MSDLLRFDGAVKHDANIEAWLAAQSAELRALATPWLTRMRQCGPDVRELMHDGLATVCVRDVPFAYVGIFSAHVNVGFFYGASLADQWGLIEGSGKYMRHVKLRPSVTIDSAALESLISAAYRDAGLRVMFADQEGDARPEAR